MIYGSKTAVPTHRFDRTLVEMIFWGRFFEASRGPLDLVLQWKSLAGLQHAVLLDLGLRWQRVEKSQTTFRQMSCDFSAFLAENSRPMLSVLQFGNGDSCVGFD